MGPTQTAARRNSIAIADTVGAIQIRRSWQTLVVVGGISYRKGVLMLLNDLKSIIGF